MYKLFLSIVNLRNFLKFKRFIRKEQKNKNSKFNQFGFNLNQYGTVIYIQLNFDENDLVYNNYNFEQMVRKYTEQYEEYLYNEVPFGENLEDDVSQFYDNDGTPTTSFAITYEYPYIGNSIEYILKCLGYLLLSIVGIAALLFLCIWINSLVA